MLEDRVRLHWAARAFLWFVTVPTKTIKAKQEQYSAPPEPGSVVVKDDGEEWEVKTPNMRGADAANDMKAVRGMIDAGSGFPPHWRGEASDINLATAQAMQEPTERNLVRRQNHFIYMLHDIIWHAYQRAHEHSPSRWPAVPQGDYEKMFTTTKPDIAKTDNPLLAQAARELSTAASSLSFMYSGNTYKTKILQTVFKFLNEPLDEETTQQIITESQDADTTVNDNLATAVSAIKVGANG
ncbi:MAG: hypothetical protein GWP13_00395, partial [Planctomycetia bacterium]|nr:hypothetical protein [Planctomycetia bacterium]